MPTLNYRYCPVGVTGGQSGTRWFYAQSDENAVAQVQQQHPGCKCELWRDDRLVAIVEPSRLDSVVGTSRDAISSSLRLLRETAAIVTRHDPQAS